MRLLLQGKTVQAFAEAELEESAVERRMLDRIGDEVARATREMVTADMFRAVYAEVFSGDDEWAQVGAVAGFIHANEESHGGQYSKHKTSAPGVGARMRIFRKGTRGDSPMWVLQRESSARLRT